MPSLLLAIVLLSVVSTVLVAGQATGVNCDSRNPGVIDLKEFIISPRDPIRVGDETILGLAVQLAEDLVQPIQTDVVLKKKFGPLYITAPCLDGVGSCSYPDWCDVCTTCSCPLKEGRQQFSLPFSVTSSDLVGTYRATIYFTSATGQTGCIEVNNIVVE